MILEKSGTGKKYLVKMVQMGKVGKNDTLMSRFSTPKTLHLKLLALHSNPNTENVPFLPRHFHLCYFLPVQTLTETRYYRTSCIHVKSENASLAISHVRSNQFIKVIKVYYFPVQ